MCKYIYVYIHSHKLWILFVRWLIYMYFLVSLILSVVIYCFVSLFFLISCICYQVLGNATILIGLDGFTLYNYCHLKWRNTVLPYFPKLCNPLWTASYVACHRAHDGSMLSSWCSGSGSAVVLEVIGSEKYSCTLQRTLKLLAGVPQGLHLGWRLNAKIVFMLV